MNPVVYQISKISDNTTLYVGSTINLRKREIRHAYCTRNVDSYKTVLYTEIAALGGWGNVEIRIIQEYPGVSRTELYRHEMSWQSTLKPRFNINKAYTPLKGALYHRQYRSEKPREYFNNTLKEWRAKNPEKVHAARVRELEKRRSLRRAADILSSIISNDES